MNYELKNLDFWDNEIKKLSSKYLKSILKLCKKYASVKDFQFL